jgi:hypothetical protein
MSNFRIIVGDKYYMGETGEISDKFHDPWSTNSFHTSRVQRSILGFSDDPLDAKFIQDRTTLIGEARRIIEYLLYTDIGWRDIKIEGEPFAIPLKLNIDYFLDLESDASKMKAINTEMKKQLDISTDLGQKRFEENVALLARAEKAEAEEKEWREIAERSNQLLRSAYSIAQRKGVDTNWDAFERCLEKELVLQHNYRADLINKISVDVKRDLSDAEIEELGAREAENGN